MKPPTWASHLISLLHSVDPIPSLSVAMDEVHWSRVRSTRNCTRPPYNAICNLPLSMPITQILPLLLAQPDLLSVGDTTLIGISSLKELLVYNRKQIFILSMIYLYFYIW